MGDLAYLWCSVRDVAMEEPTAVPAVWLERDEGFALCCLFGLNVGLAIVLLFP